ncbi:hypothetical protein L1987_11247 [Smallanthus sonchifolius]|uniref:Uncharacterized protein n=1 Tax=Smallanthus sonchifolius TaxID=185202 RepID=A0ACB9JCV5_9ASTR|nr:hypothetical protein L1987_11247 [Smallanthus sonchifolius]
MDSNEVEIKLKHLAFLKEIAVNFLVILSNVYDFVKENSGDLKSTVVSAETAVGPLYEKLKDLAEQVIVFVDDKFDKHSPSLAKKLVVILQSLINKTTPLAQILLTTAQSIITPLATTTISLFQKLLQTTKSLIQNILTTTKSAPLVGTTQSLLQNSLDTAKSLVQDTILQKGSDVANQALDTTKSLVGGIPLVGNVAQSLITNPTDLANQLVNTTNSLVNKNPVFGVVDLAVQNMVKETQATGTKAVLQSAYMSFKLAGIPIITQFWYKVSKQYPWVATLSEFILPVVEYVFEWYNKVVTYMDGKDYSLFGYLPLVPIDEMKDAYKLVKTSMDGLSAVGDLFERNNNNNN